MGAILLTVNTAYKRNELKYLMTNSEAENIFIINGFRDSDYIEILYDLAPELRTMDTRWPWITPSTVSLPLAEALVP